MEKFRIMTDSCVDLPASMVGELELEIVPLSIIESGKIYHNFPDEREITNQAFYQLLREKKVPTTSQLSPAEIIAAMEPILQSGCNILSIWFSSALSGTFQSAVVARKEMMMKFPDRKIIAIDSLCASMGQGLLLTYAAELKKTGKPIEEVASWTEEHKLNVSHLFTVDDLNHLKRGGRLSAGKAFLGTLIKIKPLLHMDVHGKLVQIGSVRSRIQSLNKLVEKMCLTIKEPEKQVVYISHGDCIEDALYVKGLIEEKLPVKNIVIGLVGPVIASHSGLGTLAIFYFGSDRIVPQ